MKSRVRVVAIIVAVVFGALAVVLAINVGRDPRADADRSRLLGRDVPAFDLPLLNGDRASSEGLAGKTIVINFWNSWCIPCRQEHQALVDWWSANKDDSGVTMLGIVREDTKSATQNMIFHKSGVSSSTMPQTLSVIQWKPRSLRISFGRGSSAGRTLSRIAGRSEELSWA